MKKKVRVDFSAHTSIVVAVDNTDDYLDRAIELAEDYVTQCRDAVWEVDDDGVDDVGDDEEAEVTENAE
jgi:hypothetical protein